MKNALKLSAITLTLLFFGMTDAKAQFVDGLNIEEINTPYLFVTPVSRIGRSINLSIDFGQEQRTLDMRATGLLDNEGRAVKFNSIVDGLNYLYTFGYELDETLVDPTGGVIYVLTRE